MRERTPLQAAQCTDVHDGEEVGFCKEQSDRIAIIKNVTLYKR